MKLAAKAECRLEGDPRLAVIERPGGPFHGPYDHRAYLTATTDKALFRDVRVLLVTSSARLSPGMVRVPPDLAYLQPGDIVRFHPARSEIRVLFRCSSGHNVLFLTERCNSRCLMCSQPPRDVHDHHLVDEVLQMVPWIPKSTAQLGITGGEPTLLHGRLLQILEAAKEHLPSTSLHLLSNGRLLCYLRFAEMVAAVRHPDLMIGVPLYADTASGHDYVVQAAGAFDQTILGLLNLGRVGLRTEIRIVMHRETYRRLPQLARFVARNLPFVHQVVFMGLELTGYARANVDALWIDPVDYQDELERAVEELIGAGLTVGIFNLPLCLLRPALRRHAHQSISDWKRVYLPACVGCAAQDACSGFFASAGLKPSSQVHPLPSATRPQAAAGDHSRPADRNE